MKENYSIDPVAIYAAIISTITLLWNIGNSILEKSSKLAVSANFYDMVIPMFNGNSVQGPKSIKVSIVNRSKRKKYVKSINIKLPYKTNYGSRMASLCKLDLKFPIEIKPEDEYTVTYTINSSAQWMFDNYKKGKFNIVLYDTTNKAYKSKKVNTELLRKSFEFNKSIPEEILDLVNK